MIRLLIISTLLITFLATESEYSFVSVTETGSEVELTEVSEKLVSQHQIHFRKSVKQRNNIQNSINAEYVILSEVADCQIYTSPVKKNILLMQFVI